MCVHESVADEFVAKLCASIVKMYGVDPKRSPDFARMLSEHDAQRVASYILRDKVVIGGDFDVAGRYVAPTVLYPSDWGDPAMQQEVFGPVLCVLPYEHFGDALAMASDHQFGLASVLYTENYRQVMQAGNEIEAGELYINRTPADPYQGYHAGWKRSGLGGDDGKHGMLEFTQTLQDGMQDEDTSKRLLQLAGIDVAAGELAADADAAVRLAKELGYPVVLKIVAEGVTHKSDMGGVQLDLRNATAVRAAFARIRRAAEGVPGAVFQGCLVQPMIKAESELMLGTLHDPQFGPFLLVGAGGTLVELMKDTKLLPAPASPQAIERALRGLRCFPLLDGYRGREPADLDQLVTIAHRVSVLAATLGPRMPELDINPLAVRGARAVALDARMRWARA